MWEIMKTWGSKIILFSTTLVLFILPLEVHSWGFFAHKHINYHAVFLLPPSLIGFYKKNIGYIASHAVDPDKRRYAIKEEAPRHYIDLDHYNKDKDTLPHRWSDAIKQYSEDSLMAYGIVPWWIMVMKARLTKAFQERDVLQILKTSADIGHYIADAHVPLHANSNHNGQKTEQHGIHGLWESRLPELFAQQSYDLWLGKAQYLSDPASFIWTRVYESAAASDSVLAIEKQLSQGVDSDLRFSYELRNGKMERQFARTYSTTYHVQLNGMVERRMRDAIYAVACFWYSAWIDAGQPSLK
jgi:hypothetical protein